MSANSEDFKLQLHNLCWEKFKDFHQSYVELLASLDRENSSLSDYEVLTGLTWPVLIMLRLQLPFFFDVEYGLFKKTPQGKLSYLKAKNC